jgi:hypothetical protein
LTSRDGLCIETQERNTPLVLFDVLSEPRSDHFCGGGSFNGDWREMRPPRERQEGKKDMEYHIVVCATEFIGI